MEEKRRELLPIDREAVAEQRERDQAWAREHLKQDWLDGSFFRGLAADYGLRLAPWWKPASETRYIRRALAAAGKDSEWFKASFGYYAKDFCTFNPRTPAWVAQAMVLELASLDKNNSIDYREVV